MRQLCCHPGLIKGMLDQESLAPEEGIEDAGEDIDLISRLEDMNLDKDPSGIGHSVLGKDIYAAKVTQCFTFTDISLCSTKILFIRIFLRSTYMCFLFVSV
jgi:hypothetical protein